MTKLFRNPGLSAILKQEVYGIDLSDGYYYLTPIKMFTVEPLSKKDQKRCPQWAIKRKGENMSRHISKYRMTLPEALEWASEILLPTRMQILFEDV